jgi:DNA-binding MarR family transcriptional regulator
MLGYFQYADKMTDSTRADGVGGSRTTGTGRRRTSGGRPRPELQEVTYLVDAIFRLERAVGSIGTMRLRPWNMTLSSFAALRVLEHQPNLSLAQLSRRCFVKPQTMTRMVAELERRGYVHRGAAEESERAMALTLTELGRSAVREMSAEVDKVQATLEQALTPVEVTELNAMLRRCAVLVESEIKDAQKAHRRSRA